MATKMDPKFRPEVRNKDKIELSKVHRAFVQVPFDLIKKNMSEPDAELINDQRPCALKSENTLSVLDDIHAQIRALIKSYDIGDAAACNTKDLRGPKAGYRRHISPMRFEGQVVGMGFVVEQLPVSKEGRIDVVISCEHCGPEPWRYQCSVKIDEGICIE